MAYCLIDLRFYPYRSIFLIILLMFSYSNSKKLTAAVWRQAVTQLKLSNFCRFCTMGTAAVYDTGSKINNAHAFL
jgi:hypothetical protein